MNPVHVFVLDVQFSLAQWEFLKRVGNCGSMALESLDDQRRAAILARRFRPRPITYNLPERFSARMRRLSGLSCHRTVRLSEFGQRCVDAEPLIFEGDASNRAVAQSRLAT